MRQRIAVIPGDGIGKEVLPEGMRVLDAAGRRFGFDLEWKVFDWSCEVYAKTGRMMPEDGLDQLRAFEAIFLGAESRQRVLAAVDEQAAARAHARARAKDAKELGEDPRTLGVELERALAVGRAAHADVTVGRAL